jgi:hypothetical protein
MLHNIAPNRKRSKDGSLTEEEKPYVKRLLLMGYLNQDIVHVLNQGRCTTVNQGRISKEIKNDEAINEVSEEEAKLFIKIQSSYDPITLLNPYKHPRLVKARESMITAIQLFNTPTLISRGELFCIHANIGWTYLLHEKMEKDNSGSSLLENGNKVTVCSTLDKPECPLKDKIIIENLTIITRIRNDAEHGLSPEMPDLFHSLFLSCCINFENTIIDWFGEKLSLSSDISLALQFCRLDNKQLAILENSSLPPRIRSIYEDIQNSEHANDIKFQATVHYSELLKSKSASDVHKFTNNVKEANIIAVKKIQRDPREEFPLTCSALFSTCKDTLPEIKKNREFYEILKKIIKPNEELAMIDMNASQRSQYKKNKTLPSNPTYIYKNKAVNVLISEFKNRKYAGQTRA